MKAQLLGRERPFDSCFRAARHIYPAFLNVWHYHAEIELVYIQQSTGTRFIGDNIEQFKKGDLVLIGENLPHLWLNDLPYFQKNSGLMAEALTIHFKKNFGGMELLDIPEMANVQSLIQRSEEGLIFDSDIGEEVEGRMTKILDSSGINRLIAFLELLEILSLATSRSLSTRGFSQQIHNSGDERMDKVYSFTYENFKREITLEEVSSLIHFNTTSFCRYFKKSAQSTYFRFLNEIRIGYACKLLLEDTHNISEIAYKCGYNNLSNFNRQFKIIKGTSPSNYLSFHKRESK